MENGSASTSLAQRVDGWLCQQPTAVYEVSALARDLGISREYLSRQFKAECAITIKHYLSLQTVSAARRLLQETNQPIGDVAEQLGFKDIYAFSRFFKRFSGETPSACRRAVNGPTVVPLPPLAVAAASAPRPPSARQRVRKPAPVKAPASRAAPAEELPEHLL